MRSFRILHAFSCENVWIDRSYSLIIFWESDFKIQNHSAISGENSPKPWVVKVSGSVHRTLFLPGHPCRRCYWRSGNSVGHWCSWSNGHHGDGARGAKYSRSGRRLPFACNLGVEITKVPGDRWVFQVLPCASLVFVYFFDVFATVGTCFKISFIFLKNRPLIETGFLKPSMEFSIRCLSARFLKSNHWNNIFYYLLLELRLDDPWLVASFLPWLRLVDAGCILFPCKVGIEAPSVPNGSVEKWPHWKGNLSEWRKNGGHIF